MQKNEDSRKLAGKLWENAVAVWDDRWQQVWSYFLKTAGSAVPLVREAFETLPSEWGFIGDRFETPGGDLILLMVSRPNNTSIQLTIGRLLRALVDSGCLRLICVTGSEGYIDVTLLAAFPAVHVREDTAKHLLDQFKISGPEYCAITANRSMDCPVFGVEESDLYVQTYRVFVRMRTTFSSKDLKEYQELNRKRAPVLVGKTMEYMKKRNVDLCSLVAEPDMLPEIKSHLTKRRLSYLEVHPTATSHDDWDGYMKRLKGTQD